MELINKIISRERVGKKLIESIDMVKKSSLFKNEMNPSPVPAKVSSEQFIIPQI